MFESSISSTLRLPSIALWLPVVLGCIVVGAAIPLLLVNDDEQIRVTSQLELTEEVGWPFYGAVRQRVFAAAELLDADSFFPQTVDDFAVELPADETWLDVIVLGSNADDVLESANELNTHLLETVNRSAIDIAVAEAALVQGSLDSLEAERAVLDREIAAASEDEAFFEVAYRDSQSAGTPDPDLLVSLNEAEDRLSTTRRQRDATIDQISRLERELEEIERPTTGTLPVVRELRSASVAPFEDSPRTLSGILGALTGLIVGVVLARAIYAVRAPVRGERSVSEITGVPVIPLAEPEIPVRLVQEARAGSIAVVGSEDAVTSLVNGLQNYLGEDDLLVLDAPDTPLSSSESALEEARKVADAESNREVVLLDASPLGSAWSQLAMNTSASTFVVLQRGERSSGEIERFVRDVSSRSSKPVQVLLLPEA